MEVRCEYCGQAMEVNDLRRRYHKINPDGILCALEAQRMKTRNRQREFTKKNKHQNITETNKTIQAITVR